MSSVRINKCTKKLAKQTGVKENCKIMTEKLTQDRSSEYVYYCTLGRGMDPFVKAELGQIDRARILKVTEGKIFFSAPHDIRKFSLKTAERILILVLHQNQDSNNDSQALFNLQRKLTEKVSWDECLKIWRIHKDIDPKSEEKTEARLNVKVTGSTRKLIKPDRMAGSLSKRLKFSTTHYSFVVKNAQVSIDVHISDAFITAGLALSSASQAFGGPDHGLRSTTASAMAMCLSLSTDTFEFGKEPISKGIAILDPMCGKGSILGSLKSASLVLIGVDNDKGQLDVAKRNNPDTLIIQGDARRLPFDTKSVDLIVCDLPFGLKYNKGDFKELVPKVINEMQRVIKTLGRVVMLFARSEKDFLEKCATDCDFKLIKTFDVMLGVLEATIFVFYQDLTENKHIP